MRTLTLFEAYVKAVWRRHSFRGVCSDEYVLSLKEIEEEYRGWEQRYARLCRKLEAKLRERLKEE